VKEAMCLHGIIFKTDHNGGILAMTRLETESNETLGEIVAKDLRKG
jgi:hypothetical protein